METPDVGCEQHYAIWKRNLVRNAGDLEREQTHLSQYRERLYCLTICLLQAQIESKLVNRFFMTAQRSI